ncbi:MAG: hypothetical protein HC855_09110 [Rhizobiales bacterium]|nr:hypothetical protein [Hyphomicrobiales bacterium]
MKWLWIVALLFLVLAFGVVFVRWFLPVDRQGTNFSQYPGHPEYAAANPSSDALPSNEERQLLRRHMPRFFKTKNGEGPIDFYADYIASGTLRKADGALIASEVTPAVLNANKEDPIVVFEHLPSKRRAPKPAVLARIDRINADEGPLKMPLIVLTYHAVFRHSGLPAGISWWQELGARLVGDAEDWHQLDHYTAVSMLLDASGKPLGLMMMQHNYQRSYLFGEGVELPADGRPLIDIALRSNELYPHKEGRTLRPAVSFLEPRSFAYMIGAASKPMMAASDVTEPDMEASYELRFLPPSDAFYTFKGYLGARRALPGRDGPPGANYNAIPRFKPLGYQIALSYWREGNASDIAAMPKTMDWVEYGAFAQGQAEKFRHNAACFGGGLSNCSPQ